MKLSDMIESAKQVVTAPLANILCVVGALLLSAAFFEYDKNQGLTMHRNPSLTMTLTGFGLVVSGLAVFYVTRKDNHFRDRLDYKKGVTIKRSELTIVVKECEIQNICNATSNTAIVLPTNTSFCQECAVDARTALGAYFLKHFPADIGILPECFSLALTASAQKPNRAGNFAPGATIILPDKFARPAKILITASTLLLPNGEITSNPHIICNCVEALFTHTAKEQLDTINMPILGSGHGGVDKGLALLFLLLAVLHYSKTFHHMKVINILVHPKDIEGLHKSKELKLIVAL